MKTTRRWLSVLWMSWLLVIPGCLGLRIYSNDPPPCHRDDVESAFAANGTKRTDGLFITYQCFDRLRGDAQSCVKTGSP